MKAKDLLLADNYAGVYFHSPAFYSSLEIKETGLETVKIRGSRMGKNITMQNLKTSEIAVFSTILVINELLQARSNERADAKTQYPDTVFAIHIAFSLFNHDRELSEITQKAYFSILNSENTNIRLKGASLKLTP